MLLLLVQTFNLPLDFLGIFTGFPNIEPLFALVIFAGVDDFKHVLGRILIFTALPRTLVFKVVQQGLGVLPNLTKVDGLATFGEEKKSVELLEEDGAGLMNGT